MGMELVRVEAPETSGLEKSVLVLVRDADAMQVETDEDHNRAQGYRIRVRDYIRNVDETFHASLQATHRAHRTVIDETKRLKVPAEQALGIIDQKIIGFRRKRQAEEDRRRREEEERQRKIEEENRLQEAQSLVDAGRPVEEAEAVLERPVVVPAVATPKRAPEPVAQRRTWSAEIVSLLALVRHVAQHPEDVGYLIANGPALNARARADQENMRLPGVRAVARDGLASHRRSGEF